MAIKCGFASVYIDAFICCSTLGFQRSQSVQYLPWIHRSDVLQIICRMSGGKGLNPTSFGTTLFVIMIEMPAQMVILRTKVLVQSSTGTLVPSDYRGRGLYAGKGGAWSDRQGGVICA